MKRITYLFGLLGIVLIFGSCNGDDTDEPVSDTNPNELLVDLSVKLNGQSGTFQNGLIPFNNPSNSPLEVDRPREIDTQWSAKERIDLVYQVESNIQEVYFAVQGIRQHYTFTMPTPQNPAQTQAVSLSFEVPDEGPGNSYIFMISVKDRDQRLSNASEIAVRFLDEAREDRVIYIVDSEPDSKLSSFNFNTNEVVDIGSTGYELLDIVLVGDDLYGVTSNSELVAINTDTAESNIIGVMDTQPIYALDTNRPSLYGVTANGDYLNIDRNTAQVNLISNIGPGIEIVGDLSHVFFQEIFYATVNSTAFANDQLVRINETSGNSEFIGDIGFRDITGTVLIRNQLYGLTRDGRIIIIEPNNGRGTLVEMIDGFRVEGATVVPEFPI